ncbi:MAG: Crp/Fnr family transcriptional regulator [Cellulophaga sp.]
MHTQIISFFENFISLNKEDIALVKSVGALKHVSKNEFLLTEGKPCSFVAFINKGLFRAFYTVDGQEYSKQFFFENGFCSDYSSFLTQRNADTYLQAIEDSTVLILQKEEIDMLYEKVPKFVYFGKALAESLFIKISDIKTSFILNTPEERYSNFVKERPKVVQRVPQYMIASYLGITPEALSRIRKRLTKKK